MSPECFKRGLDCGWDPASLTPDRISKLQNLACRMKLNCCAFARRGFPHRLWRSFVSVPALALIGLLGLVLNPVNGQSLVNGLRYPGTLSAGNTQANWTLPANLGDQILLRLGAETFNPRIDLYSPAGVLVKSGFNATGGGRDGELTFVTTNAGDHTVRVSSFYGNNFGNYALSVARMPGVVQVSPGDQGGPMTNGVQHAGVIEVGDLDLWTFEAAAGDAIVARMGATGYNPQVRLFGPSGLLLETGSSVANGGRDAELTFRATNTGSYTLVANAYYGNGNGPYIVSLAKAPGLVTKLPGDDGGLMTNGVQHAGVIDVGDLDVWTFEAVAGDAIVARMGATDYNPQVRLYSPLGVLLDTGFNAANGGRDAELTFRATNSGSYTLVANSYYANGNGPYIVSLAKAPGAVTKLPGDDGGPLTNGVQHVGVIDVGDLDVWTFDAAAGDSIIARMGATGYNPHLRLYSPLGILIASGVNTPNGGRDAELSFRATNSGTYTLVANAYYANGNGPYIVSLAKAPGLVTKLPGDDGGPMTNGVQHAGMIDVGDLDVWTFDAAAGDSIVARMGATGYNPHLRLYSPLGVLLETGAYTPTGGRDAELSFRATNSGTYTLVANAYYGNGTGPYIISLAKAPGLVTKLPGDDGGPMTNGVQHVGMIDVGDLDVWTFDAAAGDSIVARMGATDYNPHLRLYSPLGILIASGVNTPIGGRDAELSFRATNSGSYTLVANAYYANGTGPYILSLAKGPGAVTVSPGDQGGPMTSGFQHKGQLAVGDLDVWTFTAAARDNIVLRLGTADANPQIRVFGPTGAEAGAAFNSPIGARDTEVAFQATNSGVFTVVVNSYYNNGAGDYILTLAHLPALVGVAPGDEGGPMTNAVPYAGVLEVGDLEVWTFLACRDTPLSLRCDRLTSPPTFTPRLRLYGQSGLLLASVPASASATPVNLNYRTTNSGMFTVVLSSFNLGQSGTYRLTALGITDDQLQLCPPAVVGTNYYLGGFGGVPGTEFIVHTATNVGAPFAEWSPFVTNQFNADGMFELLRPMGLSPAGAVDRREPQRYFRLRTQ